MCASLTSLPVLGVPVKSKALDGMDALLSIAQMPKGVPVGTLAIGEAGAANAALHVIAGLALHDAELAKRLEEFRVRQSDTARSMNLPGY
jgi:5-(carboxyamino)imidazole ribonucleotide mutase